MKKKYFLTAIIILTLTITLFATACSENNAEENSYSINNAEDDFITGKEESSYSVNNVEGTFIRTKNEISYVVTDTMNLSNGTITREKSLYNLQTDSYSYGDKSYGSYVIDDDTVYVTWDDGDKERYIFNNIESSLTHSVEEWVYYKN